MGHLARRELDDSWRQCTTRKQALDAVRVAQSLP
jgi:hypothetical protein